MIDNIQVTNTETVLASLSGPSNTIKAITSIIFFNPSTTVTANLTLRIRASGVAPSDNNTVIKNLPIPPEDTFVFDEKIILVPGDIVSALSTESNLTATINYVITQI